MNLFEETIQKGIILKLLVLTVMPFRGYNTQGAGRQEAKEYPHTLSEDTGWASLTIQPKGQGAHGRPMSSKTSCYLHTSKTVMSLSLPKLRPQEEQMVAES